MAAVPNYLVLTLLLLQLLFMVVVQCDEEDSLLEGINKYRISINLTSLTKNDNAECVAGEIADQFKDKPCTNTTGSSTVLGTEPQFTNYPNLLSKCHVTLTNTKEGAIMPACVPNLDQAQVLSNFTQSQYTSFLNDSNYVGAGISSEDNWIVVVLTRNTDGGNFGTTNAASMGYKIGLFHWVFFIFGCLCIMN